MSTVFKILNSSPLYQRFSRASLLNPGDEKSVVEALAIENLVNPVAHINETSKDGLFNVDNDQDDDQVILPLLKEQLRRLATSLPVIEYHIFWSASMRRVLLSSLRAPMSE